MSRPPDREEARKLWNEVPCGSQGGGLAILTEGSREWFDEVARLRYEVSDPWLVTRVPWGEFAGRSLLEIGHGMGTDLVRFARHGAVVHGIDITEHHHRLAHANLASHGFTGDLQYCDAAGICHPDNTFDVVYSMGVLHHAQDTEACLNEVHRVLKPGGTLLVGLYHQHSVFHYQKVAIQGIFGGKLFRIGYRGLLATIEQGSDGINVVPTVRLFSRSRLRRALARFSSVDIVTDHFREDQLAFIGPHLPSSWRPWIAAQWGWYVFARATK